MAFVRDDLALAVDTIGGGNLRIHFYQTSDGSGVVTSADYFANVAALGVREDDIIIVAGPDEPYTTGVSSINAAGDATVIISGLPVAGFATTAEIIEGIVPNKPIAPDQLRPVLDDIIEDTELYAQRAEAAALLAQLSRNDAALLIGTSIGMAGDFVAGDTIARGGAATTAEIDFERDTVAYGLDEDGRLTQYAADEPVNPYRDPVTGDHLGMLIHQPRQGLIYHNDDLLHPDWDAFNDLVVEPATGIIAPDGTETAWLLTDANTFDEFGDPEASFGGIQFLLPEGTVDDDEWITGDCWFKQPATNASSVSQMKVVFYKSGNANPSAVGNLIISQDGQSVVDVVKANTDADAMGYVQPYANGWCYAWLSVRNNAVGKDGVKWYLLTDTSSREAASSLIVWRPNITRGKGAPQFRMPDDQAVRATLTSAKWNTLAGDTTPGVYGGGVNLQQSVDFTTGWTLTSTSSAIQAGTGVGGRDMYRITDTSNSVFGFAQGVAGSGAGASDWVYFPVFINRTTYTGQQLEFRHNMTGGPGLATRVSVDPKARAVIDIPATHNASGTLFCEVVPTTDPDVDLWVVGFQNNGSTTPRFLMYPDFGEVAGVGFVDVGDPGIITSAADDKWVRTSVPALDQDHVSVPLADKYWTSLSFTVFVDLGPITPMLPSGSLASHILSVDKGTVNGRWELRIQVLDDDEGTYSLVGRCIGDDGTVVDEAYDGVELSDARWWLAVDATGWSAGRDDQELIRVTDTVVRPTGLTHIRHGQTYAGTGAINASIKRWAHVPRRMSPTAIDLAGTLSGLSGNTSSTEFTAADLTAQDTETKAAATALAARERDIQFWTQDDFRLGISAHDISQSFANGGISNIPPYTTAEWLDQCSWDTTKALMFYGSVRGGTSTGDVFVPVTDYADTTRAAGFNRLEATADNDGNVYTQAQIEAGSAAGAGEVPIVAAEHEYMRRLLADDPTIDFKTLGVVAGSKNEGAFSDVAGEVVPTDSSAWNRATDALEQIRDWAYDHGYAPGEVGQYSAVILKGEAERLQSVTNIINGTLAFPCGIGYAAGLDNLDARNVSVFGVSAGKKILKQVSLPSMHWVGGDMSPGTAWLQLEEEREDVVVFAATYAVQNDGTNGAEHATPLLGSAALGLHAAESRDFILNQNRNFFIPRPHRAWWLQNTKFLRVGILAMDYPIIKRKTALSYSSEYGWVQDFGFRVYQGATEYMIANVEVLSGGSVVEIELQSKPASAPIVEYAGNLRNGRGNIYDSRAPFTAWDVRFLAYDEASREPLDADTGLRFIEDGDLIPGNRGCAMFRIQSEIWEA
jgi:hypothetical protein